MRSEGKPRRSHGKIGFASLARTIADKWKNLDDNSRSSFEDIAAQDKARYKREKILWKKLNAGEKSRSRVNVSGGQPTSLLQGLDSIADTSSGTASD